MMPAMITAVILRPQTCGSRKAFETYIGASFQVVLHDVRKPAEAERHLRLGHHFLGQFDREKSANLRKPKGI